MSLQAIVELLNKQRIVEDMVRNQGSNRVVLVESVVHKQHRAELQKMLGRLSSGDLANILEALSPEDALLLWEQIGEERRDEVLWEGSDALRTRLAGSRELACITGQIRAYQRANGRVSVVTVTSPRDLEALQPVWVDLLGVSKGERNWIGAHFGLDLPDPDDVTDLEASARYYVEENDEVHLHCNFLLDREGDSRSVPVAFIVHAGILFTVRNEDLPVFRLQRLRIRNQPGAVSECHDLLLALYAADVEYSADSLEDTYLTLQRVGREVLSENITDTEAARVLAAIGQEEDLNGRVRRNMLDTQRAVSFLLRGKFLSPAQAEDAREILRDIESLNSHTAFLFEKINFLMDATVGFINVNQNQRVTQLTVVSVVFMPINVLAGVGGMSEFSMMTQGIPWEMAYAGLTLGMAAIGGLTYLLLKYFERRYLRKIRREGGERLARRSPLPVSAAPVRAAALSAEGG